MKKSPWLCLLLLCSCFSPPSPCHASENTNSHGENKELFLLSLEELMNIPVQSSGLFTMERNEAPGIYYVTDKKKLDKYGYRSIGEYLNREIPGIHTGLHGNQGTLVGVRGIMIDVNAKTLLLRDNINLNTRTLTGINGSKLSSPLIGDIDRVEVSLGPGALQHGSGAINGFINLISASGETSSGVKLTTSYGSGESKVIEASYGHVFSSKSNIYFYAGYSKSEGVDPYYTVAPEDWAGLNGVNGTPSETFQNNAKVGKTDDDYKFSFRYKYGREDDFLQIDLKAMLAHTTNVDPALGEYLTSSGTWREEVRLTGDAARGRYSPFYIEYAEDLLIAPEFTLTFNDNNTLRIIPYWLDQKGGNTFSDELMDWVRQFNIDLADKSDCPAGNCREDYTNNGYETHMGISFIHTYSGLENQHIGWGAEAKHFEFHYFDFDWTTVSLFGEDQLNWKDFSFLFGLRYDKTYFADTMATITPYDDGPYVAPSNDDSLTKRLAATYRLSPAQSIKLSYQEGFRFADKWPQHWAKHWALVNGVDKSDITPEESTSYELNYINRGLLEHQLHLTASFFYNEYEYTHGWINELFNFGNSRNKIKSYGTEIDMKYHPVDQAEFGLSYSFAKPIDSYEDSIKIANMDDTWTRYPEHMIKFRLSYQWEKLFAGAVGVYESPRYDKQLTQPEVASLFDDWDFIMDVVLSYRFSQYVKATLTAKELLHQNYNQNTAYFQGTRPLDNPRAKDPQYFLTLTFTY